jgi:hypothetical protein
MTVIHPITLISDGRNHHAHVETVDLVWNATDEAGDDHEVVEAFDASSLGEHDNPVELRWMHEAGHESVGGDVCSSKFAKI